MVAATTRMSTDFRAGVADPGDLVLLQGAQQLDLQIERHLADLIKEQRAAVGRLEATWPYR